MKDIIENIEENKNYILAEINIRKDDIKEKIRIINTFEEYKRIKQSKDKKDDNKYENEKEIKENCLIKINNKIIEFKYLYEFKEEGKYTIEYSFKNKIKNLAFLFYGCNSLTNIDLSNFKTQNVINMRNMFFRCDSLTNIDLSNFNTKKVTNMSAMFLGCSSLANIDLSNFNTQNVERMLCMFLECNSLIKKCIIN